MGKIGAVVSTVALLAALSAGPVQAAGSELSEEPLPLLTPEELPSRTPPLIEIGPDFLGTGNLPSGIELPTGAVWTPALWVFGDFRTSINYVNASDQDDDEVLEWANRLDLFFHLNLSGTERILLGISPVHDDDEGQFSGYAWEPDSREGTVNGTNLDLETFFFEGEIGEIFPNLDPEDAGALDIGFAVGRQPVFFQEGMMFNDTMDAIALTRDTIIIPDLSIDTRATALAAFGQVNRDDNNIDDNTFVLGLFTETDFVGTTTNLDIAYVISDEDQGGDGFYLGTSATQRFGLWNTSFRGNMSIATEEHSDAVSTGGLLFAEVSTTPIGTNDVAYGNAFWGIDEYSSAARDHLAGGPLGRTGLLFAAVGLGSFPPALSNRADHVVGGSIGYQKIFNDARTQVVVELGGRKGTDEDVNDAVAIGARFQQALGKRYIIRLDGFARWEEDLHEGFGIRTEFLTRF